MYIKRDDMLGLTGGGNKTRKLEFSMADALVHEADTIVTCGAVQSNHCRLTLSACIKEGLRCILVLEERVANSYRPDASGNNYLFHLLGAEKIIKVGLGEAPEKVKEIAEELRVEGRSPYIIPGGASNQIGALGYCACAQEIQTQQFTEEDVPSFDYLVTASGSGGTHAGLAAAMYALRSPTKVVGISTRHPELKQKNHIHSLAQTILDYTLPNTNITLPEGTVVVKDQYVGEGYSLPTKGMVEAVTMFARLEGVLLDPVYTGKAAAGLIDLARSGYFPVGSNVLFLHTGGAPSLYHYQPVDENVFGIAGAGILSMAENSSEEKKHDKTD